MKPVIAFIHGACTGQGNLISFNSSDGGKEAGWEERGRDPDETVVTEEIGASEVVADSDETSPENMSCAVVSHVDEYDVVEL